MEKIKKIIKFLVIFAVVLFLISVILSLLIPLSYAMCLSSTQALQINTIENDLNLTHNSLFVILEDMCSQMATKNELNFIDIHTNARINDLKVNVSNDINTMKGNITSDWNDALDIYRNETLTIIENKTLEEINKYKIDLDMGNKLSDIIIILNRSKEWDDWKSNFSTENEVALERIRNSIFKIDNDYATKQYVDNAVGNHSVEYQYKESADYTVYVIGAFVAIIIGLVVWKKVLKKDIPKIPYMPAKSHPPIIQEKDIKELQMRQREEGGDMNDGQVAKGKDKQKAGR